MDSDQVVLSENNKIHDTAESIEEKLTTKSRPIDPSLVITEFLNLLFQLEELLQGCDPMLILGKCYSLLVSEVHNIPMITTEYRKRFQEIEHIHELIHKLSAFVTWDNHSILNIVTEASNIPEATMLLTQFDDSIDSSQPLTRFPIPAPSYHMVPYDSSPHTIATGCQA